MSWLTKILGASGVNQAEVSANNELLVRGAIDPNKAGLNGISAVIDDGTFTGTPRGKRGWITEAGRLLIAPTMMLWDDTFNATAEHTGKYQFNATTQTAAQAAGLLTLNSGASLGANTDSGLRTYRYFPIFGAHETRCTISATIATAFPHVVNNTIEFGLFSAVMPGQAAPTDGIFFRYNAANELRGIVSYNGTEVQTAAMTPPSTGVIHDFMIITQADVCTFWIDRQLRGIITILTDQPGTGQPFMAGSQPLCVRQRIGATPPGSATKFQVSDTYVAIVGLDMVRPWSESRAGQGYHAYQGQEGGVMGSLAAYANSANPTAAVPTNTTAALGTGLGGQFWETASLALGTDGIICSFQNPAPTVNITGRMLYITGISIDSTIQAVIAGGPFGISYSLAFGHTALSLATGESASFASPGTKAPRRIALGKQVITAAQAVATKVAGGPIIYKFTTPIPVAPGEFIALVTKHETGGTVGTAGTIAHNVTFDGYFE